MTEWTPASKEEVEAIIQEDLKSCSPDLLETWMRYRVPLRKAPINRYGKHEEVWMVAQRGQEAMYWEDVEEGFNFSPLGSKGEILEHWCDQDELFIALRKWTDGLDFHRHRCGPAEPIPFK